MEIADMRSTMMGRPLPDDLDAMLPPEMKAADYVMPLWLSGLLQHAYALGRSDAKEGALVRHQDAVSSAFLLGYAHGVDDAAEATDE